MFSAGVALVFIVSQFTLVIGELSDGSIHALVDGRSKLFRGTVRDDVLAMLDFENELDLLKVSCVIEDDLG